MNQFLFKKSLVDLMSTTLPDWLRDKNGRMLMVTKTVDLDVECISLSDKKTGQIFIVKLGNPKKKPYWVEVEKSDYGLWLVFLKGRNNFNLYNSSYAWRKDATQMAKRLAKNLGLEVRNGNIK